jgi:cardiolipin synthase
MRRLLKVIFSRLVLFVALIIAEFLFLVFYLEKFAIAHEIFPLLKAAGIILTIVVVNQDIDPAYKIAWIIVLLAVPVIGVPLYLFAGNKTIPRKLRNGTIRSSQKLNDMLEDDVRKEDVHIADKTAEHTLCQYGSKRCGFPVYVNTKTVYYTSGEEWFPVYLNELQKAEHFIFIEMFIIDKGYVWDQVLSVLKEKAAAGVDVKLIYDDVGSVTMPQFLPKKLRSYGIETYCFNRLRPALIVQMNNRDHRKITVIDNKVAFTGGVNLADEYINRINRFGYWRDSALMVKGPAVWSMCAQFLGMYHYLAGKADDENYEKYHLPCGGYDEPGYVQPFADSPQDKEYLGMSEHLNLINHARDYVYINTPYLLLNESISRALINAAKNGVRVVILTPHHPDKQLVFQATRGNYERLLKSGVKIYEFTPGFNHAKTIVADDEWALAGSINTDFRSYFLHFEDGVMMYRTKCISVIREDFEHALASSQEVTLEQMKRTNVFIRVIRSILHVLMPLA